MNMNVFIKFSLNHLNFTVNYKVVININFVTEETNIVKINMLYPAVANSTHFFGSSLNTFLYN